MWRIRGSVTCMEDPQIRRSLGLLCLSTVCLVLGLLLKGGDGASDGIGTVLASLGFFGAVIAVASIGFHLFRT